MSAIPYRLCTALRLAPVMAIAGCVSVYAPLTSDADYPASWAPMLGLGPECKMLTGNYDNAGTLAVTALNTEPVLLTGVLGLAEPAPRLSLAVVTRKLFRHGDSVSTLQILPNGNIAARREVEDCFCVKQTLVCKITESYRLVPYVSLGGAQRNVYFSLAQDGALTVKLQDYHIDVTLLVPVFGKTEPWARFLRTER